MESKTVRFESDVEQRGFTTLPNVVLTDATLTVQARLTYAILRHYAWQEEKCWPGQAALAGLLCCSERSLRSYIAELALRGLVKVERRGQGRTNVYILCGIDRQPASDQDRQPASGLDRKPASGPYVEEDSVKEDSKKIRRIAQDDVRLVFDYWREKLDKKKAKLDSTRRGKIQSRLADGFSVEELKKAIDGCSLSGWHMGDNPSRKKYDDITLICRDASHVESFVASVQDSTVDWSQMLEREA